MDIIITDEYQDVASEYYAEQNSKIASRTIIIVMIILICLATLFIAMKSYANENMIYTMVYRLLGINKGHIIKMYGLEITIASLIVTIPISLITVGIFKFVEALPGFDFIFVFSFFAYLLTNVIIITMAVLVSAIPCAFILRRMPAQLVSAYDL